MKKILSCGAGVQSTTLLLLSCKGELPKLDAAVFADTGWEPQAVYDHLQWLKQYSEDHGIPFYIVKAGDIREKKFAGRMPWFVKNADTGEKGIVPRGCTDRLKIDPVEKKISELVGRKKGEKWDADKHFYEHWFGISADEIRRCRMSDKPHKIFRYPLIEDLSPAFRRQDCIKWCKDNGFQEPPRSACLCCPYHSDAAWRKIKEESPEDFAMIAEFERQVQQMRAEVGYKFKGMPYLHPSLKPLDEVDLSTAEDNGQGNLFLGECSGMCNT